MKTKVKIYKEGVPAGSMDLPPGEYSIGRDKRNDIVLDHDSISKNHASLTVEKNKVIVADNKSKNGVYYDEEPIQKRKFNNDFEIGIGPFFYIVVTFEKHINVRNRALFEKMSSLPVKFILMLSFTGMLLVCFFLLFVPLNTLLKNTAIEEIEKKNLILARTAAIVNSSFLAENRYNMLMTDEITKTGGIEYTKIADVDGKIISPIHEMGKSLNIQAYDSIIEDRKPKIIPINKAEKLIVYPISAGNRVYGAAVLKYNIARAMKNSGSTYLIYGGIVIILLTVVSYFLSTMIDGIISKPFQELTQEVGIAFKDERTELKFNTNRQDILDLIKSLNRWMRRMSSITAKPDKQLKTGLMESEKKGEPVLSENPDIPDKENRLQNDDTYPMCRIGKRTFEISRGNSLFSEFSGVEVQPETHIAEFFSKEPGAANAIFELISMDEKKETTVSMNSKNVKIEKAPSSPEDDEIVLIFKESGDEPG